MKKKLLIHGRSRLGNKIRLLVHAFVFVSCLTKICLEAVLTKGATATRAKSRQKSSTEAIINLGSCSVHLLFKTRVQRNGSSGILPQQRCCLLFPYIALSYHLREVQHKRRNKYSNYTRPCNRYLISKYVRFFFVWIQCNILAAEKVRQRIISNGNVHSGT